MQAYVLIKVNRPESVHFVSYIVSTVKGVIKADRVLGPWDVIAKIEGETRENISKTLNDIVKSGEVRDTLTMIVYE